MEKRKDHCFDLNDLDLGLAFGDVDTDSYPNFNVLVRKLCHRLSPGGVTAATDADLKEPEECLRHVKASYLQTLLLYDELRSVLSTPLNDDTSAKVPSPLANLFHMADARADARFTDSDSLNTVHYLFGLNGKDFHGANASAKTSFQQHVTPLVESNLKEKCLALQRFWNPESQKGSDNLTFAKANQLPKLIEDAQSKKERTTLRAKKLQSQNIASRIKYHMILSEELSALERLIHTYKAECQLDVKGATSNWLIAKRRALTRKLKLLQLQITMDTYPPESVLALKKLKLELDSRVEHLEKNVRNARASLGLYESFGVEFQGLARQYAALTAEIDNRKWAIAELKSNEKTKTSFDTPLK